MIVSWNYRERDTLIQRLDPRARVLFTLCAIFALIQTWDGRVLLVWTGFCLLVYGLSRLTWTETRRFWTFVLPFITFLVLVTMVTGRGGVEAYQVEHIVWAQEISWPLVGPRVVDFSIEQILYAVSQFMRMICMAILGLLIPFTIHPAQYGVTFRGLGLSDKFAVATDLAFRLVPTVAQSFETTLSAQKARGYELDPRRVGLVQRVRNLAPLIVPVTIGTILSGEEIIDAMDLRAFGAAPRRTWITELHYTDRDRLLVGAGVAVLLLTTALNLLGYLDLWVPSLFLPR